MGYFNFFFLGDSHFQKFIITIVDIRNRFQRIVRICSSKHAISKMLRILVVRQRIANASSAVTRHGLALRIVSTGLTQAQAVGPTNSVQTHTATTLMVGQTRVAFGKIFVNGHGDTATIGWLDKQTSLDCQVTRRGERIGLTCLLLETTAALWRYPVGITHQAHGFNGHEFRQRTRRDQCCLDASLHMASKVTQGPTRDNRRQESTTIF